MSLSPLYNAGIALYAGAVRLASISNTKARLMMEGHAGIWQTLNEKIEPGKEYIWFHAASLGEFEQGRPLMERLREIYPEKRILLTFFSPSGYEVRKNYPGADVICYLPFDTPGNVRRFVDLVNPVMAIFIKYEIWVNYLNELHKRDIPTLLISAIFRPDQTFFKPYGRWYRNRLSLFNHIFVQDEGSHRLLDGIGIRDVTVAGDTRFDRVLEICAAKKNLPLLQYFREGADMVMMAGSSWEKDEDIYIPWVNSHPGVKTVIAPHEFDRERLEILRSRFKDGAVLLSEIDRNPRLADVSRTLIIDCFGMLSSAYAYCDLAYVGGAFGAGLHNINEAAVYGVPVIFGPKYDKFLEAKELTALGGAVSVNGREAFDRIADEMLSNPAERRRRGEISAEYIRDKAGASDIIIKAIKEVLSTRAQNIS